MSASLGVCLIILNYWQRISASSDYISIYMCIYEYPFGETRKKGAIMEVNVLVMRRDALLQPVALLREVKEEVKVVKRGCSWVVIPLGLWKSGRRRVRESVCGVGATG